jgi:hypothetical protein
VRTDKITVAASDFVEGETQPDLDLPADRMPEAKVDLRLADFILSRPGSGAMASVAVDGASIRCR